MEILGMRARKQNTAVRLLAGASMLGMLATLVTMAPVDAEAETTAAATPKEGEIVPLMLPNRGQQREERLKKADQSQLHRLDFRVQGSGCAACLGRIRKRIDKLNGIIEVAVAIKPPYGVSVIYDASKVTQEKIFETGKKDEKLEIFFRDPSDVKIDKLPFILVPKFNSLTK